MSELQAYVRLTVGAKVSYGEDVLLCGSSTSLGSWDISQAALMQCKDDAWAADLALPCGVRVEFKVIIRPQGGSVRWYGAGNAGQDNIILETSLGRAGALPSRFVCLEGVPFPMQVADLCPEASTSSRSEPDSSATRGLEHAVAIRGSESVGPAMAMSPEVSAAAMLAGHAAIAGHAVTYTTTTTTTTSVTINGSPVSPACAPYSATQPCGPAIDYAPSKDDDVPGNVAGEAGSVSSQGPAEEDVQALVAARKLNADVQRAGPLPLTWQSPGAKDVRVRGSWDGWKTELALEPCPGNGFRLMLVLPAGQYEFKFIVDGNWTASDSHDMTSCANKNNTAKVDDMVLVPVPLGRPAALALPSSA
eukprot:TRINITY_DN36384_c0_g1_i1.p1 TRINITY_DN36384_c0_g1~~TRINITY_DN36384_c0_g1_i1.p1  ORF type:complete len:362 (-),score=54.27 TRINITY_DN36384_c0_g1_i1:71-1156(-)